MQNEQYVISLIRAVLGIQPYPITSPSDAALPFVIWNFVAGEEEFDLSGPSGFREETYTFTIVARTYDEVVDIREYLRTLLQNSSPLTFVNTGESPTFDSAEYPSLYVQSVLYTGLLPTTTIVSPQVLSASYSQTCSFLTGTIESASYAVKSKTAETASYMAGAIESASYATTAAFALNVPATASHALVADTAITASYALNTPTLPDGLVSSSAQVLTDTGIYSSSAQLPAGLVSASAQVFRDSGVYSSSLQLPAGIYSSSAQLPSGIVSGSQQIANWSVLSSSYAVSSSHAVSASWAPQPTVPETSSYALQALSASWAPSQPAVSASYAATASTWNGYNVWVGTTAQYNALSGSYDAATLYFVKA